MGEDMIADVSLGIVSSSREEDVVEEEEERRGKEQRWSKRGERGSTGRYINKEAVLQV